MQSASALKQDNLPNVGRVDPTALPVRFSAVSPTGRRPSERRVSGRMMVHLNDDCVIMQRTLANGLPIKLSMDMNVYRGVAARIEPIADSETTYVRLELLHADPSLCVPLSCGTNFDQIAVDWQAWSQRLHLPMLLIEADGTVTNAPRSEAVAGDPKMFDRRRNHTTVARRGRFQRRRKAGQDAAAVSVHQGREIIARS